jgi:Holliday junction DNA helicase RuvA
MIDYVTGTIKTIHHQAITIEVAGAYGFSLYVPDSTSFTKDQSVSVYTYLHWNQENGPTLYGFHTPHDRTVFLLIISCPGIGPKIGLAILGHLGAHNFIEAIQQQDEHALSKVNGIGARKASQIIIQLRDKVTKLISTGVITLQTENAKQWHMLTQALESLNYSRAEITHAIQNLKSNSATQAHTFDQLMRQALSLLAKQV